MFIYENGNSLNLTFKGNIPVDNPEVIIKGYTNGASLTVNGTEVVSVSNPEEFDCKAKTLVYQKDNKMMITFKGIDGMNDPEVTLNEVTKGTVEVVVNGTPVTLTYTDTAVEVGSAPATTQVEETVEPTQPSNTVPKEPEVIDEGTEEPEEVTEE